MRGVWICVQCADSDRTSYNWDGGVDSTPEQIDVMYNTCNRWPNRFLFWYLVRMDSRKIWSKNYWTVITVVANNSNAGGAIGTNIEDTVGDSWYVWHRTIIGTRIWNAGIEDKNRKSVGSKTKTDRIKQWQAIRNRLAGHTEKSSTESQRIANEPSLRSTLLEIITSRSNPMWFSTALSISYNLASWS